ncbi:GNAT family N-acetyltransferase [Alkalihalophilus marmarensis]|uniref:GNAT family N-acetyltransferase n=1 Tax=Alkalihalophilus marmarensis TaxID=521377 RepID=UPI002DBC4801|nr:GNAT family N-acetyltransferase [Alkalihalophilus marmarensis]MEC2071569.1 GNAT family N-acetyltransferase [Alkalihalophilus marmarensis]
MEWMLKTFNELTINELYELIQLRIDVFVVEQNCPYKELDNKDQTALHLLGYENGRLIAYSRLFKPGDSYGEEASIGRVIVRRDARSFGYGKELLMQSITRLEQLAEGANIKIQAQEYLHRFYQSFGFQSISEVYDEDGIPHVDMIRSVRLREE